METKKLELLVIEDNTKFLEVAKKAYGENDIYVAHYVSTYEDAIDYLDTHKVDVVISDLFFPARTDFRKTLVKEIELGLQAMLEKGKKFYKTIGYDEEKITRDYHRQFEDLTEIPSGLEIARYCSKKDIPFCLASQGDRHGGDLAIVRATMRGIESQWLTDLKISKEDPFPDISVYDAGDVDKSKERTWIDAIDYAYEIKNKIENPCKCQNFR